jgi:acetyltransferase
MLMETPPSVPEQFTPEAETAHKVIASALADKRNLLTEPEAKQVLAACGIPIVETRIGRDAGEAVRLGEELGFPVALKILSPDISHKSDVGGVMLNLESTEELRSAAEAMLARCRELRPQARLTGFTVQKMVKRGGAHELIAGVSTDPVFGPVILFGQGGTAVETIADKAIALPPLNLNLARELVSRTRIAKLLAGYRDRPPIDHAALHLVLVQLSQLVADIPEVIELDVNPLLADEKGVLALDARIKLAPGPSTGADRFAIRPYPKELEEWIEFQGRLVLLRPIRPEDEPQHNAFLARIEPEDIRYRFFRLLRGLPHSELARLTQIDYDREMAFIATAKTDEGAPETLGVVRAIADPDNTSAEFAILVRSDLKGKGLGRALLKKLVRYCRTRGIKELVGEVLADNRRMIALAARLGFRMGSARDGSMQMRLEL